MTAHDTQWLDDNVTNYLTGAIAAEIDHKRYAQDFHEHMLATKSFSDDIADTRADNFNQFANDMVSSGQATIRAQAARIAELEAALAESHERQDYYGRCINVVEVDDETAGKWTRMINDVAEPHPLLQETNDAEA